MQTKQCLNQQKVIKFTIVVLANRKFYSALNNFSEFSEFPLNSKICSFTNDHHNGYIQFYRILISITLLVKVGFR